LICCECDVVFVWCSKNFKNHCKLVILSNGESIGLNSSSSIWW
jgi:hypothetical protein